MVHRLFGKEEFTDSSSVTGSIVNSSSGKDTRLISEELRFESEIDYHFCCVAAANRL